MHKGIKKITLSAVNKDNANTIADNLAIEEPLQIGLEFGPAGNRLIKNISVTMRTPGNDAELAAGFLFTEGIIYNGDDIADVYYDLLRCAEQKENIIQVSLKDGVIPHLQDAERNFYTTSSCGVCGKGSISAIRTAGAFTAPNDDLVICSALLYGLPEKLRKQQAVFASTGGLHASALFSLDGDLLQVREDVGRHNALDKLIGAALFKKQLPLTNTILLLSGRASFELVQKAAMAGIRIIAAVGAPSSLAVELAAEFNITLTGFLRENRFNIYTSPQRILLPIYENTN